VNERQKRQIVLTEYNDGSWIIEEKSNDDSIWPAVRKASSREMIARLMQLVNVGPVAPQTHPERVGIDEL
jgi:hypothetical protein